MIDRLLKLPHDRQLDPLLDLLVADLAGLLEPEEGCEFFAALREQLTRDELLDCVTVETVYRLRQQVNSPSRLILTLN